jgi:hypothetical protein
MSKVEQGTRSAADIDDTTPGPDCSDKVKDPLFCTPGVECGGKQLEPQAETIKRDRHGSRISIPP